jgi:hypothetical protein
MLFSDENAPRYEQMAQANPKIAFRIPSYSAGARIMPLTAQRG